MKTLEPLITNYLKIGEYVRKLSSNTIKAYRTDLTQYSYLWEADGMTQEL